MADSLKVVVSIPNLRVKTLGNTRRHWRVEAKEAKEQRGLAKLYCSYLGKDVKERLLAAKKLKVQFVRVGGRKLDTTNAVGAFKHVQDGMCDWLGRDDRLDWYEWTWPVQEGGSEYSVRIILETVDDADATPVP